MLHEQLCIACQTFYGNSYVLMQPIQIKLERHSTRLDYSQSYSRKAAYLTHKLSRSIILTAFHTV
jgi:hypothetical protein